MTDDEWLHRAAAHYMTKAAVNSEAAQQCAAALLESKDDFDTPEDAVEEDLTYWTDDGDGVPD